MDWDINDRHVQRPIISEEHRPSSAVCNLLDELVDRSCKLLNIARLEILLTVISKTIPVSFSLAKTVKQKSPELTFLLRSCPGTKLPRGSPCGNRRLSPRLLLEIPFIFCHSVQRARVSRLLHSSQRFYCRKNSVFLWELDNPPHRTQRTNTLHALCTSCASPRNPQPRTRLSNPSLTLS